MEQHINSKNAIGYIDDEPFDTEELIVRLSPCGGVEFETRNMPVISMRQAMVVVEKITEWSYRAE